MAPPFIAYYGAIAGGKYGASLLAEAYKQCKLYRQYLSDGSGLWRHIVLGSWQDNNHWGTGTSDRLRHLVLQTKTDPVFPHHIGNGWAAAGMLRVFETIARSGHAWKFAVELADLAIWIDEILTHSWAYQVRWFDARINAGRSLTLCSLCSTRMERCTTGSTRTTRPRLPTPLQRHSSAQSRSA